MNVSGIKIEKNSNGTLKTVTFDLEKYGKILQPILEDLGVWEDSRLQKKFYSLDQAKTETKRRLTEICRKDKLS
ncbi:hypothetical protein [uncultured Chryseobacterium sp.]|uniref:hypothetical protein n=1 Tax=uncultured Chryseobacterium sp. TaxID=259322 RepID=UPI0025F01E01|nr:hypothetical protein [uncultured Chryseobacterium sp.]